MSIKIDKRILSFVLIIVIAVPLSVGTFLLCQPMFKIIGESESQEALYIQGTIAARDLLASKDISGVVSRLVTKEKISDVLAAIKKLAEKNNVSFSLDRPPFTAQDKGKAFRRVLFYAKATSSLKHLGSFLAKVREMPEGLIDVESLRLLPNETDAGAVNAEITFVLFVAKNNG